MRAKHGKPFCEATISQEAVMEAFTFTAGYLRTGPAESVPAGRKPVPV